MSQTASQGDAIMQRILEGSAPLSLRSAAARGALPLGRAELTRLYVLLLDDEDAGVRSDAESSLGALSAEAVRELLAEEACAPEVVAHYAKRAVKDESLAEPIIFRRALPDAVLGLLASRGNAKVIELVLTNQERLLTRPNLLDRLTNNPALRPDQRGRIVELLDRVAKLVTATPGEDGADDDAQRLAEEAARMLDVDVGELFAASEILGGEEFEEAEDPVIRSAYRKIVTMNTAHKAILAIKGGREERMILIRDTNKVVALSVLRNPRLSENDVEQISLMRNVTDEVLRQIGNKREWNKSYTVVKNLVHNPRTPPGIATNFVSRLQNKDLKNLLRDRNVPEIIRRMAKRIFDTRTQKKGTIKKKH